MSCPKTGMCKSAAACFISGSCLETGKAWEGVALPPAEQPPPEPEKREMNYRTPGEIWHAVHGAVEQPPAPTEWSFDGGKTWTTDPAVPTDMFGSPDILSRPVQPSPAPECKYCGTTDRMSLPCRGPDGVGHLFEQPSPAARLAEENNGTDCVVLGTAQQPSPARSDKDAEYELLDGLREAVSDFRKATYEFARGQDPSDHAAMMEAQRRIFDEARSFAAKAQESAPSSDKIDVDAESKTVWWDRAAGGFYLSYESISEKHRSETGRIVKMVSEAGRTARGESIGDDLHFCDLITELHVAHDEVSPSASKKAWAALVAYIDARSATAGTTAAPVLDDEHVSDLWRLASGDWRKFARDIERRALHAAERATAGNAAPTELSNRLRAIAASVTGNNPAMVTPKCLTDAADELDRLASPAAIAAIAAIAAPTDLAAKIVVNEKPLDAESHRLFNENRWEMYASNATTAAPTKQEVDWSKVTPEQMAAWCQGGA